MPLTDKDIDTILRIVDDLDYDEIKLEIGDLKLHVSKTGRNIPSPPHSSLRLPDNEALGASNPCDTDREPPVTATSDPISASVDAAAEEGLVAIRAPVLGTFYRTSSPEAKPFVEEGVSVNADDTVCLIETMKLYSSVKAEVNGVVAKILVENEAMVEYQQALMLIKPVSEDVKAEGNR